MKSRIFIIFIGFAVLWSTLIIRAVQLQVLPNSKLEQLQKKQFKKIITLKSRRGAITDRSGKDLAVSIASFSLYADPKIIKNSRQVARRLSRYFKISFKETYEKLKNKKRRFVWIQRQLTRKQKEEIFKWKITGLSFIDEPKRVYPNDHLLSQVIGFVGREGSGLEGIENHFENDLSGDAKKINFKKDARGRPLLINGKIFTDYPEGLSLQLTIDSSLQYLLEKEINFAIEKHDADSAVGIILDAETSEILAMANAPTFNINKPLLYGANLRRNRVVTDAFEPGSTMKTFVVAGALKNKIVKPSTKINCEDGEFKVDDRVIHEAEKKHNFSFLTVSEILSKSSNIGTAKIALKLGDLSLRQTLEDFGFGFKTEINLPGESKGILQKLPWRDHLLSTISFGHGIAVTPLQMVMAYGVIANGGLLKQPLIVKSMGHEIGGVRTEFSAKTIRRVLSEEDAATMQLMLMAVTSETGTGANARIPGYPVAGKTGTAQKVDPNGRGYLKGAYISSFAGFVPANKPKFVIYIAVDNPRNQYYGSQVAAPIFAKIASSAVRRASLEPILISKSDLVKTKKAKSQQALMKIKREIKAQLHEDIGKVPNLSGLSLREVYKKLHSVGVKVKVVGRGQVVKTWPSAGELIPKNKKINVLLKEPSD